MERNSPHWREKAPRYPPHGDKMQVTCGVELCRLLVDAYLSDAVPADEAAVARLHRILDALPCDPGSVAQQMYAEEATRLVVAALKWMRKQARRTCVS